MVNKVIFVTQNITDSSAYSSTRHDLGDLEGIGTLRWIDDKCYRWCQSQYSTALVAGNVVYHTYADGANALKYVANAETIDLGFMAGVVASTTIAASSVDNTKDGGYGWIQCLGYNAGAYVLPDTNATLAAGALVYGIDDGVSADYTTATAMGTAPIYSRFLMLMEACSLMTTNVITKTKVYVNCL